ncbi:MAG: HNH endonuclease [Litoreibacter sp.]
MVTKVPFNELGYPVFSGNQVLKDITITPTDSRTRDRDAATLAADLATQPLGYVWHHHEEYGRIQLVEKGVHGKTGHKGGWDEWGQYGENPDC